jgi:uncharacterized protein YjiS (DUF1127 family)
MGVMATFAVAAIAVLRAWRRNYRERRALASLSPRERYELGFVGDVDLEINKPFWRK